MLGRSDHFGEGRACHFHFNNSGGNEPTRTCTHILGIDGAGTRCSGSNLVMLTIPWDQVHPARCFLLKNTPLCKPCHCYSASLLHIFLWRKVLSCFPVKRLKLSGLNLHIQCDAMSFLIPFHFGLGDVIVLCCTPVLTHTELRSVCPEEAGDGKLSLWVVPFLRPATPRTHCKVC